MTAQPSLEKKIRVRYESGRYVLEGIPARLREKCDAFFELSLARGIAPRTIRCYAFDLAIYLRYRKPGLHPFRKTTHRELAGFIKAQRDSGSAPASINRRLNSVEVFYRYCFGCAVPHRLGGAETGEARPMSSTACRGERFLGYDPTLGIFPVYQKSGRRLRVRVPGVRIRPLEPPEVQRFMTVLRSDRDRAAVLLMLLSGLRLSEVLGLKLSDIDRLNGSVRVLGKGNKERVVPIAPLSLETLDQYLARERPARTRQEANERVFLVLKGPHRGTSLSSEGLRSVFRAARAASGVRHAHPHRFRHTFGANLAAQGVSLQVMQRLFGHSDHRTSIKYIWLFPKHVRAEYDRAMTNLQRHYEPPA